VQLLLLVELRSDGTGCCVVSRLLVSSCYVNVFICGSVSAFFFVQTVECKMYKVQQKSVPLRFFAVFSATVWDFKMKVYSFIY